MQDMDGVKRTGRICATVAVFLLVASCSSSTDQNAAGFSNVTGSTAQSKRKSASGKLGGGFAMNLPKDPKTGAYKICLRPQDVASWKKRKAGKSSRNVASTIGQNFIGQYTGQASSYFGTATAIPTSLMASAGKKMPVCGNWCGLGFPKPTENPPFVDALDGACRAHDLCYRKRGVRQCSCDQKLADKLLGGRTLGDLNSIELRMVLFFQGSPCNGGCKTIMGRKTCSGGGLGNLTSRTGGGSALPGLKLPGIGKIFGQ